MQKQSGFSLVEMLSALAIVSLVSAALYQSTYSWLQLSARVSAASGNAVSRTVEQRQFVHVVNGLIFAWPEQPAEAFRGNSDGFSGLTRSALDAVTPRLSRVSYTAVGDGDDRALVYASREISWIVTPLGDAGARFSYLGADGVWRESWPPAQNPEAGPFDDASYYPTPQLPRAIKLAAARPQRDFVWIAAVGSAPTTPFRDSDLSGSDAQGFLDER